MQKCKNQNVKTKNAKTKMSDGSPKLCPDHQKAAQVRAFNDSFETMLQELKRFRAICTKTGFPLRSVSYRVLDNDEARCHIVHRAKKRKVS